MRKDKSPGLKKTWKIRFDSFCLFTGNFKKNLKGH